MELFSDIYNINNSNVKCSVCYKTNKDLIKSYSDYSCRDCYNKEISFIREETFKRSTFDPQISQITDIVYLGNSDGALEKELLKSKGITHILICASYIPDYYPNDFKYLQLLLQDDQNQKLTEYFPVANKFIEEAKGVYVHCAAGVSRSASIVIAYLMVINKWDFEKAFEYVKLKRKQIDPNPSFINQLKELKI